MASWAGGESASCYHLPHVSNQENPLSSLTHPPSPHPTLQAPLLHIPIMPADPTLVWRSHRSTTPAALMRAGARGPG